MDTIRPEINHSILANEIRLERAQNSKLTIVLVEGGTDARLFRRFVDAQCASITVCFDRDRVIGVLDELKSTGTLGVMGIIDADFDHILNRPLPRVDICRTDANDVEGMILPSVITKILNEYGTLTRLSADIRANRVAPIDALIIEASKIGALRVINKLGDFGLKFKKMDHKFVDNKDITIDIQSLIVHLRARSAGNTAPETIHVDAADFLAVHGPSILMCQGHDLIRIFGRALRRRWGSVGDYDSKDKVEELEKILRVSYEEADFRVTRLYQCIRLWEHANAPWKVLN